MPRMIYLSVCAIALLGLFADGRAAGWAQITLQNDMNIAVSLYYRGPTSPNESYGCRALGHGFCTIQVSAPATYTFRATDGRRSTSSVVTINEGTTPVWRIFETDMR